MTKLSKASKLYIALLIMPIVLLILTSLLQFTVRYTTTFLSNDEATSSSICQDTSTGTGTIQDKIANGSTLDCKDAFNEASQVPAEKETGRLIVNIISLLLGIISVFLLLLTPVWIILLVMDIKKNRQQSPQPPSQFPPQQ